MCMRHKALATRKDQAANWFWVDERLLADKHLHNLTQGGLMRQRVKRLQVEDLLIDPLERRIGIATGRAGIRLAFLRIVVWQQPARSGEHLRNITQNRTNSFLRQ